MRGGDDANVCVIFNILFKVQSSVVIGPWYRDFNNSYRVYRYIIPKCIHTSFWPLPAKQPPFSGLRSGAPGGLYIAAESRRAGALPIYYIYYKQSLGDRMGMMTVAADPLHYDDDGSRIKYTSYI